MKKPLPRPRPCIVTALELIGLDDPTLPEGRARQALARVESDLIDPETSKLYDAHFSIVGNRILKIAPIKRGGWLPFWAVLDPMHLQAELIALKVLVRGAITVGETAIGPGIAFGPGVTHAERLRDEVADVPRVIVDPRVLREVETDPDLKAPHHSPMMELGYIRDLLRQDADGLWFVDYLWAYRSEVDDPSLYLDFLQDHRNLIQRKLDALKTLDRSSRMITWLWHYHEQVLEQFSERYSAKADDLASLHLPATSALVYRFPPSAKSPSS